VNFYILERQKVAAVTSWISLLRLTVKEFMQWGLSHMLLMPHDMGMCPALSIIGNWTV
jgi:hypothetical protein